MMGIALTIKKNQEGETSDRNGNNVKLTVFTERSCIARQTAAGKNVEIIRACSTIETGSRRANVNFWGKNSEVKCLSIQSNQVQNIQKVL